MTIKTVWKCLSVEEFIGKCNWENISLAESANSVIQQQKSLISWQCLTAQDFFSLNNWSGQRIFVNSSQQQDISKASLIFDLTFDPARFWQCFNWTGQQNLSSDNRIDEVIEEAQELVDAVEEFTLNDLSQLF